MMNFMTIIDAMSASEFDDFERRFVFMGRNVRKCPWLIMPIGMAGAGKSTWINEYLSTTDRPTVVVSSDNQIELIAKERGQTYTEVYPTIEMNKLEANMRSVIRLSVIGKKDIIIDRTNLTVRSRGRWLSQPPNHYLKIGLYFKIDNEVLFERLNRRARETGKKIPRKVIQDMLGYLTPPQPGEFDITLTIEQH